jgi:hypothetical protein
MILSYLGYEYYQFRSPPVLKVFSPPENQEVNTNIVEVLGETEPDATLRVNNQPVLVEEDGQFKTNIEINDKTEEIIVRAISRSGKETLIRRKIVPKLEK